MERTAAASQLSTAPRRADRQAVSFELATPAHDQGLRRLLRDNPMRGQITVSLEREPSYFAADELDHASHRTVVAMEASRVVCAGSVSVRKRYINGEPANVGYLGGLRLDHSCRGRSVILRRGYQFLRELHERDKADLYFTSIVADNQPARRFLERGFPGMPIYRPVGEFVTVILPTRQRRSPGRFNALVQASTDDLPKVLELLTREHREYQFAPLWTKDDFDPRQDGAGLLATAFDFPTPSPGTPGEGWGEGRIPYCTKNPHPRPLPEYRETGPEPSCDCPGAGLRIEDLWLRMPTGPASVPTGCAALWDQRSVKQTVVRAYSPWLGRMRPLINAANAILNRPCLPAVGQPLSHAYASHVATDPQDPAIACDLIDSLCGVANRRGIDYLTIGFDARDPRLMQLRKHSRHREYASRLYVVYWEDGKEFADSFDDRLLAPEVALL